MAVFLNCLSSPPNGCGQGGQRSVVSNKYKRVLVIKLSLSPRDGCFFELPVLAAKRLRARRAAKRGVE